MWWQSQPESYVHDRLMRIYDLSEQVSDRIVARVDGAKTSRADLVRHCAIHKSLSRCATLSPGGF